MPLDDLMLASHKIEQAFSCEASPIYYYLPKLTKKYNMALVAFLYLNFDTTFVALSSIAEHV